MTTKVAPAGLRDGHLGPGGFASLDTGDVVRVTLPLARYVRLDIVGSLLDIAANIEGVTLTLMSANSVHHVSV